MRWSRGEDSYVEQAKTGIRGKLKELHSDQLPAFGKPIGFVINYATDRAVCYDLDGNRVEVFGEARQLGIASLSVIKGTLSHRSRTDQLVLHAPARQTSE